MFLWRKSQLYIHFLPIFQIRFEKKSLLVRFLQSPLQHDQMLKI